MASGPAIVADLSELEADIESGGQVIGILAEYRVKRPNRGGIFAALGVEQSRAVLAFQIRSGVRQDGLIFLESVVQGARSFQDRG